MRSQYLIILCLSLFVFCQSNQKICEGENCRNGKHLVHYDNGDQFEGEFLEDSKHGNGIYRYANGDIFEGEYKFGSKDGPGIYRYANGDQFIGNYVKGKREGYGKYRFADGFLLEGYWDQNGLVGKAKITNAKGSLVLEGYWNQNQFLGIKPKEGSNNRIEISNPE
ncbi:MORN repeat-containing protein [Leptospira jelokensis]|uniref:Membrane-binding protein n=1 Tax=Leptospira jelokensis TaxID=2484931 RepID=A0A4Z1A672_9LEPT|nr:hypothetical protein [Leptospira jelokensis]TGL74945.1 hypothetical protein EHQ62_02370 [Leptospira jelokensis]TGM02226.1 hypothetical protein EHQ79_12675 [Leptospira jelokensis]